MFKAEQDMGAPARSPFPGGSVPAPNAAWQHRVVPALASQDQGAALTLSPSPCPSPTAPS